MSALWRAEVLAKQRSVVEVRVRQVHPDSGEFLRGKVFALRLIYDEATGYGPGLARQIRGPLGEALSLEQTFEAAYMDAHVDRFVRKVEVSEVDGPPLDLDTARAQVDREVSARGIGREDPAWQAAWDAAWREQWSDVTRLPAATYRIEVTDPRWLEHLAPGQVWESAAYED
jgi:hypothetical protein